MTTGKRAERTKLDSQCLFVALPLVYVSHHLTFFTFVLIQVEAFNLTKGDQQGHNFKRPYAYISEDEGDSVSGSEDDFEIDSTALKGILNNTGIKVQDWCRQIVHNG